MKTRKILAGIPAGLLASAIALGATQCTSTNTPPAAVKDDADVPDTYVRPTPEVDAQTAVVEAGADACAPTQGLLLDTLDSATTVSAAGTEYYSFQVAQAEGVLVRVRSSGAPPNLQVVPFTGDACSTQWSAGSLLPTATHVGTDSYTRGNLQPGMYAMRVLWDGSVSAATPYTFDVLHYEPAPNGSCQSPTTLPSSGTVPGTTFATADTSAACGSTAGYGQLFYAVEVPASSGLAITGTPSGPWSLSLAAVPACSSTTCAVPTASSPLDGSPVTLQLLNTSSSTQSFIVGASVKASETTTGGGAFTLASQSLASCTADAGIGSCGAGSVCCGGFCGSPGPANHCGQSCTACPADLAGYGTAICSGTTCALQCPTGYCLDATGTRCVAWSSTRCGASCGDCTTSAPSGSSVSCSAAGACTYACAAGACLNAAGTQCLAWNPSHCGTGSCRDCTVGIASGATASCSAAGACASACPASTCLSNNACVAEDAKHCGATTCSDCTVGAPSGAVSSCSGGACQQTCNSGFCVDSVMNACVPYSAVHCVGQAMSYCGACPGWATSCSSSGDCQ